MVNECRAVRHKVIRVLLFLFLFITLEIGHKRPFMRLVRYTSPAPYLQPAFAQGCRARLVQYTSPRASHASPPRYSGWRNSEPKTINPQPDMGVGSYIGVPHRGTYPSLSPPFPFLHPLSRSLFRSHFLPLSPCEDPIITLRAYMPLEPRYPPPPTTPVSYESQETAPPPRTPLGP